MLVSLYVKNLALIEEAEVEFKNGLNILSGETGAGKSILLGSVHMALGGKIHKDLIRKGQEYAYAELVFEASKEAVMRLKELEYYPQDNNMYVFSRKLMNGRSICKINGETCSASMLSKAGDILMNMHGQHETQTLFHEKNQLDILDSYAGTDILQLKEEIKTTYSLYHSLKKEYEEQTLDEQQRNRELAFAEFEVDEIEKANLKPGEDIDLEEQYTLMLNGRQIVEAAQDTYHYTGYQSGAGDAIGRALKSIGSVASFDEQLMQMKEQLESIDSLLNDFNRDLQNYAKEMEFEESDFRTVEDRLNLINHLKDKYGKTIADILNYADEKRTRIDSLRNYECYLEEQNKKIREAECKLNELSAKLSKTRKDTAEKLSVLISDSLLELNFEKVVFQIDFTKNEQYTANGYDQVEFMISLNPGEPVKPLRSIASGGELSRIMLALKAAMADKDEVETQIFDEIDAGISGRTAQKVSEKLAVIANKRQVICITHLPQIAAMADSHFLIEKQSDTNNTYTNIRALLEEEQINELARMLGGVEITDAVKQNAMEMKRMAEKVKSTKK